MKTVWRIVLVPRGPHSAFNPPQVVESDELPKFHGGAVIITGPRWLPSPNDPGPAPAEQGPRFQAWPLDVVASVVVHSYVQREDDDQ